MTDILQVAGSNLPAVLDDADYGFGTEISSEDIRLPFIKLCQKSTREKPAGVVDGDFYNVTTGKKYGQTIMMNVFRSYLGRAKFTAAYKLECRSDDRITGNTYGLCSQCQFSAWVTDRELRRSNYCPTVKTFLAVLAGEIIPGLLGLSKTREAVADKINSQLRFLIAENRTLPKEKRNPIYFYIIKLTSFQEEINGEKIYGIKPELVGLEKDEDRRAVLVGLFREWKTVTHDLTSITESPVLDGEPRDVKTSIPGPVTGTGSPRESKSF